MRAILTEIARKPTYRLSSSRDRRSADIPFFRIPLLHTSSDTCPCRSFVSKASPVTSTSGALPHLAPQDQTKTLDQGFLPLNRQLASLPARIPPGPVHNSRADPTSIITALPVQRNTYKYVFYQTLNYPPRRPTRFRSPDGRKSSGRAGASI